MAAVGRIGLVVLALVLVVAPEATRGADDQGEPFETGVGAVQGVRCDGRPARQLGLNRPNGTTFLVGRRVMMTAAHVAKGWFSTTDACSLRVRIGKTWYSASRVMYWADRGKHEYLRADIATFALDRPARGHVLTFATRTPDVPSQVQMAGFPWGEPLEASVGVLLRKAVSKGTPVIVIKQDGVEGPHSGGPILDALGNVISVVSSVVPSRPVDPNAIPNFGGIDIPRWWGGGVVEDLCRVYPGKGVPGCPRGRARMTKDAVPLTK